MIDRLFLDKIDPAVLALFIDREPRLGKGRVGERSERYSDKLGLIVNSVPDGRTAIRAKAKADCAPAVGTANIKRRLAGQELDIFRPEPRLRAKGASRAFLAFKTVADRNADRFARTSKPDFAARTRRLSRRHCSPSSSSGCPDGFHSSAGGRSDEGGRNGAFLPQADKNTSAANAAITSLI